MSNTFCPLPWIQVSIKPSGVMTTCCVMKPVIKNINEQEEELEIQKKMDRGDIGYSRLWWDSNKSVFICGRDSIKDVLNTQMLKDIRLKMLKGEKPSSCSTCWIREEHSHGKISVRTRTMRRTNKFIDINKAREITNEDGSLKKIDIKFIELRFGNSCNLKCVMCHPGHSNFWYSDWKKLKEMNTFWTDDGSDIDSFIFGGNNYSVFDEAPFMWFKSPLFVTDFLSIYKGLEEIYWAGGEPLLCQEHSDIIKMLVDSGISNKIAMRYDTNLTHLPESFLNNWKKFKWVSVQASVDDVGIRNEYIRYPSKWNTIETNLKRLDSSSLYIAHSGTTISCYNIFTFLDFGKWAKYNMSKHFWENMHFKHVLAPFHLCPSTLPKHVKNIAIEKIDEYLKSDESPDENTLHYIKIDMFKNYLISELEKTNDKFYNGFIQHTKNLDKIRPLKFKDCLPELYELIKGDYDGNN